MRKKHGKRKRTVTEEQRWSAPYTRDVGVQLEQGSRGDAGPRFADGVSSEEEVVAGVFAAHHIGVDDGEGGNARQNEILQDLRPGGGHVDQTYPEGGEKGE